MRRARYIEAYETISDCRSPTGCGPSATVDGMFADAPIGKKVPFARTHHGDTFVDEYEWLRDKDDAEVVAYLEAENAYTDEQTKHLQPLREQIFAEIKARTQETDLSVPTRMGESPHHRLEARPRCALPVPDQRSEDRRHRTDRLLAVPKRAKFPSTAMCWPTVTNSSHSALFR